MHSYTLREAKARLSEVLDLVAAGEEVEILRKGRKHDRFRIVVVGDTGRIRRPGALRDRIRIPQNFDREDASLTAAFEGR